MINNYMSIDFKDACDVVIEGFTINSTYSGHLEGNKQSITRYILQNQKTRKGVFYISPEMIDGALKPYVYKLSTCYLWEYRLDVIWYDEGIPDEISFIDYLQQKVKEIEFKPNSIYISLD